MQTKEVMNPQLSLPFLVHILSAPEMVSQSSHSPWCYLPRGRLRWAGTGRRERGGTGGRWWPRPCPPWPGHQSHVSHGGLVTIMQIWCWQHYFGLYRVLAALWSTLSTAATHLSLFRGASRYGAPEISLQFHLNLSETTLNNVSESAALKLASKQ